MRQLQVFILFFLTTLVGQAQILNPNTSPTIQNPQLSNTTNPNMTLWQPQATDRMVIGDFNKDKKDDFAIFRGQGGIWYFDFDKDGHYDKKIEGWGEPGDLPIAGNFDGEPGDEIALFRGSIGAWFFDNNLDGKTDEGFKGWGNAGDIPLAGNFIKDKNDWGEPISSRFEEIALYRPSTGEWFLADGLQPKTKYKLKFQKSAAIPIAYDSYYTEVEPHESNWDNDVPPRFDSYRIHHPALGLWSNNNIYLMPGYGSSSHCHEYATGQNIQAGDLLATGSLYYDTYNYRPEVKRSGSGTTCPRAGQDEAEKKYYFSKHFLVRYRPSTGEFLLFNSHDGHINTTMKFTGMKDR